MLFAAPRNTPTDPFGGLETQRLRLRRYTGRDLHLIYRLMSDPLVMRYYPAVYDLDRARIALGNVARSYERYGYSLLAAERKLDGVFVGHVGLLHWDDVDAREDVEVAYMLLPEYWGKGYATEASRSCRDWAFANLDVDRIVSFIVTQNAPSIAVAERNGMLPLKRIEHNRFGEPIYVYGISRAEWLAARTTE
jgi:ribosomal-protein-alanine N-acetyltransferase